MTHLNLPGLLLIAGTGRNSGKTTLACRIIGKFSSTRTIVALKISPHRHIIEPGGQILIQDDQMCIHEETRLETRKDSSRMLAAGAQRAFVISATEDNLLHALRSVLQMIPEDAFLICESGGLRRWVEPGLFLIISRFDLPVMKPGMQDLMNYEHLWISFDGNNFNFDTDRIVIEQHSWKTKS